VAELVGCLGFYSAMELLVTKIVGGVLSEVEGVFCLSFCNKYFGNDLTIHEKLF